MMAQQGLDVAWQKLNVEVAAVFSFLEMALAAETSAFSKPLRFYH